MRVWWGLARYGAATKRLPGGRREEKWHSTIRGDPYATEFEPTEREERQALANE